MLAVLSIGKRIIWLEGMKDIMVDEVKEIVGRREDHVEFEAMGRTLHFN